MKIERPSSNPEEVYQKKWSLCRALKKLIFILCLLGFGYQTTEFLTKYFSYPTVINTAIEDMEEFPTPAFTYCSRYLIDYGKYCHKYSARCLGPRDMESFCRDNPLKCDGNKTDLITEIHFYENTAAYLEEIAFNNSHVNAYFPDKRQFQAPFISYNSLHLGVEACYTLGTGLAETGLRTFTKEEIKGKVFGAISFHLRKDKRIYFIGEEQPYGTLFIHSPYRSFKSDRKSLTIKAGYEYSVYISLEAERLLPYPYDTNCEDYEELWMKNKAAPMSRDMCQHVCQYESNYFEIGYGNYNSCDGVSAEKLEHDPKCRCYQGCKDDCLETSKDVSGNNSVAMLELESFEKRVTNHRPQYTAVEFFSYIGGLLGCWLGISIWTCTGIFWKGFSALLAIVKYYRNILRRRTVVQNANLVKQDSVPLFDKILPFNLSV